MEDEELLGASVAVLQPLAGFHFPVVGGRLTTHIQKLNNIITSILPRQADKTAEGTCGRQRSRPTRHKQASVRGGCLGAEGRRRTRRPAKRSGGAACER